MGGGRGGGGARQRQRGRPLTTTAGRTASTAHSGAWQRGGAEGLFSVRAGPPDRPAVAYEAVTPQCPRPREPVRVRRLPTPPWCSEGRACEIEVNDLSHAHKGIEPCTAAGVTGGNIWGLARAVGWPQGGIVVGAPWAACAAARQSFKLGHGLCRVLKQRRPWQTTKKAENPLQPDLDPPQSGPRTHGGPGEVITCALAPPPHRLHH